MAFVLVCGVEFRVLLRVGGRQIDLTVYHRNLRPDTFAVYYFLRYHWIKVSGDTANNMRGSLMFLFWCRLTCQPHHSHVNRSRLCCVNMELLWNKNAKKKKPNVFSLETSSKQQKLNLYDKSNILIIRRKKWAQRLYGNTVYSQKTKKKFQLVTLHKIHPAVQHRLWREHSDSVCWFDCSSNQIKPI